MNPDNPIVAKEVQKTSTDIIIFVEVHFIVERPKYLTQKSDYLKHHPLEYAMINPYHCN
jgi:hypothetical protein